MDLERRRWWLQALSLLTRLTILQANMDQSLLHPPLVSLGSQDQHLVSLDHSLDSLVLRQASTDPHLLQGSLDKVQANPAQCQRIKALSQLSLALCQLIKVQSLTRVLHLLTLLSTHQRI